MSTAIVKFENSDMMFYCKNHSYPCGLGFDLLNISKTESKEYMKFLCDGTDRFVAVTVIPTDVQYEYIVMPDGNIKAREFWYTADKNYHGGGFRVGVTFDLDKLQEKVHLQSLYSYRRPEAWADVNTITI